MPGLVPRRRNMGASATLFSLPKLALNFLDADFLFQKSKTLLYYGTLPAVVIVGMLTEPRPSSWLELINIID